MNATGDARFGRGAAALRVEDQRLLTGRGRFTDDWNDAHALHCVFLRSPLPHARIRRIERKAAMEFPGVAAVITGSDLVEAGIQPIPVMPGFKRADGAPAAYPARHALAVDTVRFVGEAIAAVVAATRAQALDAAESLQPEYVELPSVTDALEAARDGAPQLCPDAGSNIVVTARHGNPEAADAAFRAAAHAISVDILHQRLVPLALEPRATIASYDPANDRITIRTGTQTPGRTRDALAGAVLRIAPQQLRLLVGDVGGGFGMKIAVFPEDVVLAYAARKLQRPVRWCAERAEEFLAGTHARALRSRVSLALDRAGRFLALRVHSLADLGAYPGGPGPLVQGVLGPHVATGVYDIPAVDLRVDCVLTNTTPVGAYRGAGRPENIHNIERVVEAAARTLGLDPLEIRRRNFVPAGRMPYRGAMGHTYDSGDFVAVMEKAIALADWNSFPERKAKSAREGKLRGRGIATFLEWTGGNAFSERVRVMVQSQGGVTIWSATQAMGQGLETCYAQLAADVFDLPPEAIQVFQGDTDVVTGFGSVGSRSLYVGGAAVEEGARKTIAAGLERAARTLEAAAADITYAKGQYTISGTDRSVSIFDLARKEPGCALVIDAEFTVQGESWPNGCYVCEVEIDQETGAVELVRFTAVDDVGNPINPMIVGGQIHGGIAQGVGQALLEHARHDRETGQLITGSLMDYGLPHACDLPPIHHALDTSQPCRNNPLGAKGCGESGTIGSMPAVVNAVIDALAPYQIRHLDTPLTAERIWNVLRGSVY